jgi:hypothetical protein
MYKAFKTEILESTVRIRERFGTFMKARIISYLKLQGLATDVGVFAQHHRAFSPVPHSEVDK